MVRKDDIREEVSEMIEKFHVSVACILRVGGAYALARRAALEDRFEPLSS